MDKYFELEILNYFIVFDVILTCFVGFLVGIGKINWFTGTLYLSGLFILMWRINIVKGNMLREIIQYEMGR